MSRLRFIRLLATAIWALCAAAALGADLISILHVNDLHARLVPDHRGRGGFAYVATVIARERESTGASVLLDAGDMVQGSPVSTIFQGTPAYEVANSLGIDVHALGNHEFDYGWEQIREFQRVAQAPIISANVANAEGELLLPPYRVLTVGDIEIGVIGALTPRLQHLIGKGLAGPWRALPLVDALRPVVSEIHERVDLVVVLAHLFDDEDEEVLRELPDVDVLVGGHNHGGWRTPLVIDGRIGVKLRPYGIEVGRLDLWFDAESSRITEFDWKRIPVLRDAVTEHPGTAALVKKWEARVSEVVDVPIGACTRDLSRTEVQRLVERAIRDVTGATLAYMNRGGVRDSLVRGTITARDIWNILPFDNELVEASMLGAELPDEATEGRQIDARTQYRFVTNDFVAGQWQRSDISFRPTGLQLRDTVLEWVRGRGSVP